MSVCSHRWIHTPQYSNTPENRMPSKGSFCKITAATSARLQCAVQGVRIDYALCSPGLVDKVVSCEIVSTPPKWSDHAALILGKKPWQ